MPVAKIRWYGAEAEMPDSREILGETDEIMQALYYVCEREVAGM